MLASTMQFSSNGRTHQAHRMHHHRHAGWSAHHLMTRTSKDTPPEPDPTRKQPPRQPPPEGSPSPHGRTRTGEGGLVPRPVASGPNSVLIEPRPHDQAHVPTSNRRRTSTPTPQGRLSSMFHP